MDSHMLTLKHASLEMTITSTHSPLSKTSFVKIRITAGLGKYTGSWRGALYVNSCNVLSYVESFQEKSVSKDRQLAFCLSDLASWTWYTLLIKMMASLVPLIKVSLRFMAQVIGTPKWAEQREQRILRGAVSCIHFQYITYWVTPRLCFAPVSANHGLGFPGTLPLTTPLLPFLIYNQGLVCIHPRPWWSTYYQTGVKPYATPGLVIQKQNSYSTVCS